MRYLLEHPEPDREHQNLLRRRAEEAMQGQPVDLDGLQHEDIQYLLHELHVHQVELSMQNDELRRVQLELETSRDQYSDLYDFAPAGYCTLSRKGHILESNQTLSDLLGVGREQLTRTPLSHYVDAADQDTVYLHRQRTFADGQHQVSEIRMLKSSGEKITVRMESSIAHGDKNRMRVMLSDITKAEQAEEALREAQEHLRVALEDAPLDLFTTDRELRYTWAFGSLYGYPTDGLIGKRDDELFPAENSAEVTALERDVLASGIGQCRVVHTRMGIQDRIRDMTVEPLRDKHGEIIGLTVASMDITEQQRVEREAQQVAAQREVQHRLLDQREQERQQIARDLHDGPVQELTAATFAMRGLLMGECDPETARQLEAIQTSLQAQIHELREYAGELRPPTLAKFGLEQAIRAHAQTFAEKHPDLHIRLEMHQTGEILPEVTGLALFRIYQQALVNILKHAQASEVRVQFEKDEQQAQLMIQDNGRGFELPEDWLVLVRGGHLGLIGMRERAEAVGGRLEVITQPGSGTIIQASLTLKNSLE
jgi:PAS domain S-box-containing protein